MPNVVKIETKHSGDIAEKSTLMEKTNMFTLSDQKKIVLKMVAIIDKKGKKDNWMTGLDSTKSLYEQYEHVIDKDITRDEFNFFKTLVPKGEYGTNSIVSIIYAEVADWTNRLVK